MILFRKSGEKEVNHGKSNIISLMGIKKRSEEDTIDVHDIILEEYSADNWKKIELFNVL